MKRLSALEVDICEADRPYNMYNLHKKDLEAFLDKECRAVILNHLSEERSIMPEDVIGFGQVYLDGNTLKMLGVVDSELIPDDTNYMVVQFAVIDELLPETVPLSNYPVIVCCSNEIVDAITNYKVTDLFEYASKSKEASNE